MVSWGVLKKKKNGGQKRAIEDFNFNKGKSWNKKVEREVKILQLQKREIKHELD